MTMQKFKTYQLAINFYRNSRKLNLREPLKNQFHRASLSIVLNLAEGSAKPTAKERRKFYRISLGSLRYNLNSFPNMVLKNEEYLLTQNKQIF